MIITLVIDQYDDGKNGTTMTAKRLAETLKAHGHEVRILGGECKGNGNFYITGVNKTPILYQVCRSQGIIIAKPRIYRICKAIQHRKLRKRNVKIFYDLNDNKNGGIKTALMKMNKILTFIVNEQNEILLLKENENDPQFKRSFWYVVTGGCEEYDLNRKETVKREIKEETGISNISDILYLNWIFKYNSLGIECTEYVYITFVKEEKITLNEENIDYQWCNLKDFIEKVQWFENKEELYKVLSEALKKKLYFKYEKIEKCL